MMGNNGLTFLKHLSRMAPASGAGVLSDGELLQRFITLRDEAAFAALVDRHGALVLRVARRILGNEHAAEDVFQATFLVLARRAAAIGRRELLANWLYGVAQRLALRAKCQAAARRKREGSVPPREIPDTVTDATVHEMCAVVDEEIQRLSGAARAAFLLCYVEGKTRDQAARELGISLRTLQRRLEKGKEVLRHRLSRRGISLSAALLVLAPSAGRGSCSKLLLAQTVPAILQTSAEAAPLSAEALGLAESLLRTAALTKASVWTGFAVVIALAASIAGLSLLGLGQEPSRGEEVLEGAATPPGPVDLGPQGLPAGAQQRLGSLKLRHGGQIHALAFSPDGKLAASAGRDWRVRVWHVASGEEVFQAYHRGWATAVAFAPDAQTIASGSREGDVYFWRIADKRRLRVIKAHQGQVRQVAFTRDGAFVISAGEDGTVCRWTVASGANVFRTKLGKTLSTLALSPDGRHLAASDRSGRVLFLDPSSGALLGAVQAHVGDVPGLAFSLDGTWLASAGHDRRVQLWRREQDSIWQLVDRLETNGPILSLAFVGVTHVATGGAGGDVHMWDLSGGKEAGPLTGHTGTGHTGAIYALASSRDGRTVLFGGADNAVHLWDLGRQESLHPTGGHQAPIVGLALNPAAKVLASAGADGTLRFWDPVSGKEQRRLDFSPVPLQCVACSAEGKLAVGSAAAGIRLWHADGSEQPPLSGHEGGTKSLAFSPDGRLLASAGEDRVLRLWDLASRTLLFQRPVGARAMFMQVAFSADGAVLACANSTDKDIVLYDTADGSERVWLPTDSGVAMLTFSPDGRFLLSSEMNGLVRLWDTVSWTTVRTFPPHQIGSFGFTAVAFAPDSRRLATAAPDSHIRLFDVETGELHRQFRGHIGWVRAVAFTPDGRLISASEDTTLVIWNP